MRPLRPFVRNLPCVALNMILAAVALTLSSPLSRAQVLANTSNKPPEFEVAAIKPNKSNERMYYGLRNGSLTVRNMSVRGLIQVAYGKRDFQITGGPVWITSEFFDIDAKAERPLHATHDMEKALLASRFHLQLHKEAKETSVYSLVIARGGLRMKLSADQTEPERGGPTESGAGRIVGDGVPMYVIVNLLSNMLGRTVVNNTGLNGKFDINLQPSPDSLPVQPEPPDSPMPADSLNLALIEAVEKQLGLKIVTIKVADEILVIDHIEHPSAN